MVFVLIASLSPTFTVSGRELHDRCGNTVVLRGINKMNVWTDPDGSRSLHQIKKTGANSVRIVWSEEGDSLDLDTVLSRAISLGLLPMLENHDATGDFAALPVVVDYWLRPDVLAILQKHQAHLLLNIGNEVGDEHVTGALFRAGYALAIQRLRAAGLRLPLVIDGTAWGRNIDILQANGAYLQQIDPLHNLLFSVHFWWMDAPANVFDMELAESASLGLPLVVGELAHTGPYCAGHIDYRQILAACEKYGVGYYAWEWGPGNIDCAAMDMTIDNDIASLSDWARDLVFLDRNSLKRTSRAIACL